MPLIIGGGADLVLYDLDVQAELPSRCRVEASSEGYSTST
jgi:hypothetical protein